MTIRQQLEVLREQRRQAKRAKNPKRIGAAFREEQNARKKARELAGEDQGNEAATKSLAPSGWLPSFGGVWNEGPRSQHVKAFNSSQPQPRQPRAYQSRRGNVTSASIPLATPTLTQEGSVSASSSNAWSPSAEIAKRQAGCGEVDVTVDEDLARWMASQKARIADKLRARRQLPPPSGD